MPDKIIYESAPKYYHPYFDLIQTNDLLAEFESSKQSTLELFLSAKAGKENYAYSENKWTTKEVLRHIIDCERIFAYRAFRFSRFDNTELAGFDENTYISRINSMDYDLHEILAEYTEVRNTTIKLFKPMTDEMLDYKGIANKNTLTARSIGFITVGHNLHHCHIVRTRYLTEE